MTLSSPYCPLFNNILPYFPSVSLPFTLSQCFSFFFKTWFSGLYFPVHVLATYTLEIFNMFIFSRGRKKNQFQACVIYVLHHIITPTTYNYYARWSSYLRINKRGDFCFTHFPEIATIKIQYITHRSSFQNTRYQ